MILATVITCPRRWDFYQSFRRRFEALGFDLPLRTFQTAEGLDDPRVNNNLNARAALAYGRRHLPESPQSWVLYLEDDVALGDELPRRLLYLAETGAREGVDCWYLCHRKNPVRHQFRRGDLVINELANPPAGAHALLLPQRHLARLLAAHWGGYSDQVMFDTFKALNARIWQVVEPVLAEHLGAFSTFDPQNRRPLEINYAHPSNIGPAA